jgi:tRNA nucleotidyltransferase (CCA-adding enzyme)
VKLTATVQAVCVALRNEGGRPFLVGGGVRDYLLGRSPTDFDIEVYGLPADRVRAACAAVGRLDEVGAAFGVLKVTAGGETIDVSLPRRDSKIGVGHRDFAIGTDPFMAPEEAVRRRDFTVNALLMEPFTGEVVDLVGGRDDLRAGRLRAVDATLFGDDPLRALRACRLAAKLGFDVEPKSLALCAAQDLGSLPNERVGGEFVGLLRAAEPGHGLRTLAAMDQLRAFPELQATVGCPQHPIWHPEGDVWVHTVLTVEAMRALSDEPGLLLAALCHDLGKPATTERASAGAKAGAWISYNHEPAGVEPTRRLLARLAVDKATTERVTTLVRLHLTPLHLFQNRQHVRPGTFRRLARRVNLVDLATLARADMLGRGPTLRDTDVADWFAANAKALDLTQGPPPPILMGRHLLALGVPPGPGMGAMLTRAYEAQLDGQFTDLEGALRFARAITGQLAPEDRS